MMNKKELVLELKKIVPIVYQHQAPLNDESENKIIYYYLPSLPFAEGDGKYYGKQHFLTINLYCKQANDLLAEQLEEHLFTLKGVFLRERYDLKEDELFLYRFEYELYELKI